MDDQDWQTIFDQLNEFKPPRDVRKKTEAGLRDEWVQILRAAMTDKKVEQVVEEKTVWDGGVRIDVYRKTASGDVVIYELKAGSGAPIHLYQLKMYWDGLVLSGESPKEAVLLVEDFSSTLEAMANKMNTLPAPTGSKPYNFRIEKHADKGLWTRKK